MKVHFSHDGWNDYLHFSASYPDIHRRLNALIEDIRRTPFAGLGKPEPLKGDLSGWRSRRVTGQHRLAYRVQGAKGQDRRIQIIQCRFHY